MAVSTLTDNQFWLRVVGTNVIFPQSSTILMTITELPSRRVENMRACRLQLIAAYTELVQVLSILPALLSHHLDRTMKLLYDFRDLPADLQEILRETRCRVRRSVQTRGDAKDCHDHTFCKCNANSRQQETPAMPQLKI